MSKITVIELEDRWIFPMENLTVTKLEIDYAFTISTWVSNDVYFSITIEASFAFNTPDNNRIDVTPETLTGICSVLKILHSTFRSVIAYKTGKLEINFNTGEQIVVEPNSSYEAWNLTGPGGLLYVCIAGGDFAIRDSK